MRTGAWYCTATLTVWAIVAQTKDSDVVAGTWRGESRCVAANTACRDETVTYRFSAKPTRADVFSVSADKSVDGKPVNMGILEFEYDHARGVLTCTYAQGTWHLHVNGGAMEGTLTRSDGTVFRRVSLHKEK